jgi:arylsulfatase A-like enzyme
MNRFNILYMHSHDTGRYVKPYGFDMPTPRLQGLAEEGILFSRAFCAAPTCSPSRAALLTGRYAHSSGMIGLAHRGFPMTDFSKHIIHLLHSVGYYSVLVGVQHIADDAGEIGYRRIEFCHSPDDRAHTVKIVPKVIRFLESNPPQPFFLSVGFFETHRPYPSAHASESRYILPPAPIPNTPQTRYDMACYRASVRLLDQGIGAVLDALERNSLTDNTLIICTTDHGLAFPNMKCSLYDHGIGVMLIIKGPGDFRGGRVCEAMVSQIDIFPTICELAEIEAPPWLQGKSLMSVIRGSVPEIHDSVFAEVNYHSSYEPMRAVRTHRWKYIRRYEKRSSPVLPNIDDSPSKDLWMQSGWNEEAPPMEQLYDLIFDPNETNNLALAPTGANESAHIEMQKRLDKWMRETDDPLLNGPVEAPQNAKVDDQDAISWKDPTIKNTKNRLV